MSMHVAIGGGQNEIKKGNKKIRGWNTGNKYDNGDADRLLEWIK